MKAGAVATIAIAAAAVGGAMAVSRKSSASETGGTTPSPAHNPTPSVPTAADVLEKGLPPLVGMSVTDIAPNGMIAMAIVSSDGGAAQVSNAAPSGDFDLLRFALQKSVGAPFAGLLVSKRGTQLYARNVDVGEAVARMMDVSGASVTQLSPFQIGIVKGPSHIFLQVGMPVTGDASSFLTSMTWGDDRAPATKSQSASAPNYSASVDKRAQEIFGIKSLFA